jgi:hypothetical protein
MLIKKPIGGGAVGASPKRLTSGNLSTLAKHGKSGRYGRKARALAGAGALVAEDPFFWFCSGNYALHTFPADKIPKHFLEDGSCLLYRYADFVSRTGTPDPSQQRHDRDGQGSHNLGLQRQESLTSADLDLDGQQGNGNSRSICRQVVPPAICLCQPTDLQSHTRHRWEVKLDFVDDQRYILGDTGWWPGALGNYFDFETQLANVDRYITASEVPQTRLLYIESVKIPVKVKKPKATPPAPLKGMFDSDESSSSDSDESSNAAAVMEQERSRRAMRDIQKKLKPDRKDDAGSTKGAVAEDTSNLMLPPLMFFR